MQYNLIPKKKKKIRLQIHLKQGLQYSQGVPPDQLCGAIAARVVSRFFGGFFSRHSKLTELVLRRQKHTQKPPPSLYHVAPGGRGFGR